jgi:hypothetical protein
MQTCAKNIRVGHYGDPYTQTLITTLHMDDPTASSATVIYRADFAHVLSTTETFRDPVEYLNGRYSSVTACAICTSSSII